MKVLIKTIHKFPKKLKYCKNYLNFQEFRKNY